MDKKQEELFDLEKKHFETEQMLSSCHDREKEKIKEQFDREQESIEQKHKDFDDLEFKQLEVTFHYYAASLHDITDWLSCTNSVNQNPRYTFS